MRIRLPYGHTTLIAQLPERRLVEVIEPAEMLAAPDPLRLVDAALDAPLGGKGLDAFTGVRSVAIAINDKTRAVPHQHLLPPLLQRLEALGLPPEAIRLLIAVGMHPPMTPQEFASILPEGILRRYSVSSHDPRDTGNLVYLGKTVRGTPIYVNRYFTQADLRIVVGSIEPHQFMGFSGGVKSAAIGLAGIETIAHNHAMMTHPNARLGEYEANPARQDVEEIGKKIGVHFALDAVFNANQQIVHVLAGNPRRVMQVGINLARHVCQVHVPARYDLLIVSPGGYPKDINLYQAQKGLAHATLIAQPNATLILAAACPEGTGNHAYEVWMEGMHSYGQVLQRFEQEGFAIGPHKAYQIARDASRLCLLFLSDMNPNYVRSLLLTPVASLQQAVDQALDGLPMEARIGIMPYASSTIPDIEG